MSDSLAIHRRFGQLHALALGHVAAQLTEAENELHEINSEFERERDKTLRIGEQQSQNPDILGSDADRNNKNQALALPQAIISPSATNGIAYEANVVKQKRIMAKVIKLLLIYGNVTYSVCMPRLIF